jgi:diguanylate cyclase (GGDEF)-like protein
MQGKLLIRMAAVGALAGVAIMISVLALSRLGMFGWVLSCLITAAGGAAITMLGGHLYAQSITDDCTGLYNRRYLFRRLEQEMQHTRRQGVPIALAVIDVDDFRQYNNRYGHLAGDVVLETVARALRSSVRKGDIVGRWGGEEFALILPGADANEALAVTERVRRQISELIVELGGSCKVRVTISGGVAASDKHRQITVRELIQRADLAMYNAKQQKNKVLPFLETMDLQPMQTCSR